MGNLPSLPAVIALALLALCSISWGYHVYWMTEFSIIDGQWWRAYIEYWKANGHVHPGVTAAFKQAAYVWVPIYVVVLLGSAVLVRRIRTQYGSARWAGAGDLKRMGLDARRGIVLGRAWGKPLRFSRYYAAVAWAPPGSGKTQILVIPSIMRAGQASLVINDPSGELYESTAGYRATLGPVVRISWADAESARWNPLDRESLSRDLNDVQTEIDGIWHVLIPKSKGENSQFDDMGRQLGIALTFSAVLEAAERGESANFAEIHAMIPEGSARDEYLDSDDPTGTYIIDLSMTAEEKGWPRIIATTLRLIANTSFRERSGYINTMTRGLNAFTNGHVARATSSNDFKVTDLRGVDGKPMSIYLCLRERDIETFGTITRIFLTQVMRALLSDTAEEAKRGLPINFLLDELPALGRMEKVVIDGPSRGRKLRIRFLFIAQDPAQVRQVYGADGLETLKTNGQYQVVFHQRNPGVQEEIARLIGQRTRVRETVTRGFARQRPERSLEGVYLVRPEDVGMLGEGEYFVIAPHATTRPVRGKGGWAYKNRAYRRLGAIGPPRAARIGPAVRRTS